MRYSPGLLCGAACAASVVLSASILLFYHLGKEPLQDYDEATYAHIARESIAERAFITLPYLGRPYLEKPPLAFWLMDASAAAVADPETAARLPSAIAGVLLVCAVMLFSYEASRSMVGASLGGAILATTGAFIEAARQARVDIILTLFITLAVYAFWRGLKQQRWFLLSGIALGCAVMTKDVVAIFALPGAAALAFVSRRRHFFRQAYFWIGIALCAGLVLPWHLYETLRFGGAFWHLYIGHEVIARTTDAFFIRQPTNAQYLSYLFSFAYPWPHLFIASAGAMLLCSKKTGIQSRAIFWSSFAVVLCVLAVFLAAQTKAFSYLLPLYPFMAIGIATASTTLHGLLPRRIRFVFVLLMLGAIALGMRTAVYDGWHFNPYYADEIELAREEKAVGAIVAAAGMRHALYAYQIKDLGSIMFYSRNTRPLVFKSTSAPAAGDFIVAPAAASQELHKKHQNFSVQTAYEGKDLLLLQVQ